MNQYNGLIKRGLGRTVTELDFQRQATDREGIISRLKGDLARLETKLGDLDIRAQDVENARQTRIAHELRAVKLKLSELDVLLPSARQLLELRQLQNGETAEGEGLVRTHCLILTPSRRAPDAGPREGRGHPPRARRYRRGSTHKIRRAPRRRRGAVFVFPGDDEGSVVER